MDPQPGSLGRNRIHSPHCMPSARARYKLIYLRKDGMALRLSQPLWAGFSG